MPKKKRHELSSPLSVRLEKPRETLAETMGEMRSWLDSQKVQPTAFKVATTETGVAFDISFHEERDARLFQRRFA
jgi:hypothetical protein